jgi:hypothetical protein
MSCYRGHHGPDSSLYAPAPHDELYVFHRNEAMRELEEECEQLDHRLRRLEQELAELRQARGPSEERPG